MVVMFRVFDQGFLGGTTVALLCALLINGMTFVFFLMCASGSRRCPSILETWQTFFDQSADAEAGPHATAVDGSAHDSTRINVEPGADCDPCIPTPAPSGGRSGTGSGLIYVVLILAAVPDYFVQYWFNASLGFHTIFFTNLKMQVLLFCAYGGLIFAGINVPMQAVRRQSGAAQGERARRPVAGTLRRLARGSLLPGRSCWHFTACRSAERIRSSVTTSASTSTGCRSCGWLHRGR